MTHTPSPFERLEQASKLSHQLTGKASARTLCDAFISENIDEIKSLQQQGVSLARYARLVAAPLGVRPAALLAALARAGFAPQRRTLPASKPDTQDKVPAPPPKPTSNARERCLP